MSPEFHLRTGPSRGASSAHHASDCLPARRPLADGSAGCPTACRSPDLQFAHQRRMQSVLAHIEAHLAEDLRLARVADVAAFSPFHFHRVFQAWTGETLNSYVRRRRLETGAARLVQHPNDKVTDIAQACGFVSPESFSRAFREHFGRSPSQWRCGGRGMEAGHARHAATPADLLSPGAPCRTAAADPG